MRASYMVPTGLPIELIQDQLRKFARQNEQLGIADLQVDYRRDPTGHDFYLIQTEIQPLWIDLNVLIDLLVQLGFENRERHVWEYHLREILIQHGERIPDAPSIRVLMPAQSRFQ